MCIRDSIIGDAEGEALLRLILLQLLEQSEDGGRGSVLAAQTVTAAGQDDIILASLKMCIRDRRRSSAADPDRTAHLHAQSCAAFVRQPDSGYSAVQRTKKANAAPFAVVPAASFHRLRL